MAFKKSGGSILAKTLYADLTLASLCKPIGDEQIKAKVEKQRETRRIDGLLPHQQAFLEDKTTRHLGLVAGFGSGKSYSMAAKILQLCYDNEGYTGIALEPTYGMLGDILLPLIQEIWDDWGIDYTLYRGAMEIHVRCPNGGTSKVLMRSFENIARLRGINAAWACVDEIDVVKQKLATMAFQLLQGRIRSGPMPQIAVCSTPEGHRWMWQFFVKDDDDSKSLIRARTVDNPYLPDSYIESLRQQYPPQLLEAYLQGNFVNLAQSTIFNEFDRATHYTDVMQPESSETVVVGFDFNIGQCHGCAGVLRTEKGMSTLHILEGFVCRDTYEIVRTLQSRFGNQLLAGKVVIYPDAAGQAQSTSSTKTDHQILREGGLRVMAQRSNPNVQESIAHCNALLHNQRIRVNIDRCPDLVESLEMWSWDEDGNKPVKGGEHDMSHAGDAFRYLCWGAMNGGNRQMARGLRQY